MNFANLFQLKLLRKVACANGVANLLCISSPLLVEQTTVKEDAFAKPVARNSSAQLPNRSSGSSQPMHMKLHPYDCTCQYR
jgi:hypothetical protein